ncbi:RnfABCDGE type electron transport complex subunit B [Legionella nagasakiensis]|uniref:RnfABCDGE type electron transport complex subunit B n=1 Tax=Legionella nagasakiensis TaxID=535290 RepID=UPI00105468F7|nr:RnfABCDGE type electron transport complex subunit B [Legionella nagasakiensis]
MALAKDIDKLLPQTQCGECGYPGCFPYAQALAQGGATIDGCPPGGVETLRALGQLLNIDPTPYGSMVAAKHRLPSRAVIRESECIGCTKCIQACPVDAIVGSSRLMHTVLAHECTGCGLCVEPCPVDCIEMVPLPEAGYDKDLARQRYHARQIRLLREAHEKQQQYRAKRTLAAQGEEKQKDKKAKQDFIQKALARVKAKHQDKHE